jgi:predicted dehydrogenase
LDDAEIDAVYIPLPPALHHEWTILAAERGKHVLCEKPLALNYSQAREMADACRQHDVQLMDGVMWVHHPRTIQMQRFVRDGTLGIVRRATAAFTFNWDEVPEKNIRLQKSLGGGSLLDLGWYCVGAILWAFGSLPERVFATARDYNGVDLNFSALLWYEGRRMASFDCGFDLGMRKWFEVAGTQGSLVCDDFTLPWHADNARFWVNNTTGHSNENVVSAPRQEVLMIERFTEIVRGGRRDDSWPRKSLDVQQVCDALAESARSEKIVEIG